MGGRGEGSPHLSSVNNSPAQLIIGDDGVIDGVDIADAVLIATALTVTSVNSGGYGALFKPIHHADADAAVVAAVGDVGVAAAAAAGVGRDRDVVVEAEKAMVDGGVVALVGEDVGEEGEGGERVVAPRASAGEAAAVAAGGKSA